MYSSNDKLIDEIRKRLLTIRKKNPLHNHKGNDGEIRRLSTLMARRGSGSHRATIRRKTNLNYLSEDKINLRLVPIIKSEKAIMILKRDDNKMFNTEINDNDTNFTRNPLNLKKPKINDNSNLYIKTFSNYISPSPSSSFGKINPFSRKKIFLSPFQFNKNKNKIFQNMVEFSKEIHSPKYNAKNLFNNYVNIKSFRKINEKHLGNKTQNQKIMFNTLTTFKFKNKLLNDDKNQKNNEQKAKYNIKSLIKVLNNDNVILKNKLEKKRKIIKPNCYYNKLHLNKIKDIIEKFSYNNID